MIDTDLFKEYQEFAQKADYAFNQVEKEYSTCVNCEIGCTDCCYSVFGLFPIEAVYVKYHFDQLERGERREAVLRAKKADKKLQKIEQKLQQYEDDPRARALVAGKERIKCPLLKDSGKCMLYFHRPITCRAYGIPTVAGGSAHVCYKAGFEGGESYPTFNLDTVFKELYAMSCRLLKQSGQQGKEHAASLLSLSKIIKTPVQNLIEGE